MSIFTTLQIAVEFENYKKYLYTNIEFSLDWFVGFVDVRVFWKC